MSSLPENDSQRFTEDEIFAIERPAESLWTYYVIRSFILGPAFPVLLLPSYFRFRTLRYQFDEEGVSMRWGVLFHREINLNYSRIQDIHLASNAVERWLGLARIEIQTASGSSQAEMVVEGVEQFEALRDFLYMKMRGVSSGRSREAMEKKAAEVGPPPETELAALLREVVVELRGIREALQDKEQAP